MFCDTSRRRFGGQNCSKGDCSNFFIFGRSRKSTKLLPAPPVEPHDLVNSTLVLCFLVFLPRSCACLRSLSGPLVCASSLSVPWVGLPFCLACRRLLVSPLCLRLFGVTSRLLRRRRSFSPTPVSALVLPLLRLSAVSLSRSGRALAFFDKSRMARARRRRCYLTLLVLLGCALRVSY